MDTATRLLRLLALLTTRPTWAGAELGDRLGVTPRTIRRDVARLRELEYPVEAVPGRHGGYRLGRGHEVPPLSLDDQEALAVVLGLRMATQSADGLERAAASALAKLDRVLPERLAQRLRDVRDATVAEPADARAPTDPEQLLLLAQACRQRQRVRFLYVARDGNRSLRSADPSRLVYAGRRWYLVAFDLDRDAWRTFRVDRLSSSVMPGIASRIRDEPDALALVQAARTTRAFPIQALVRLYVPIDRAERFTPSFAGMLESESDATTLWRLGGGDAAEVARWIAVTPCRVEVLDPATVRDALHAHLRTLQGLDRDAAPGASDDPLTVAGELPR